MQFKEFSKEHLEFQEEVRDFAQNTLKPMAEDLERKSEFAMDLIMEIGKKGWMGIPIPQKYGGMGKDNISYILALEELAKVCGATAIFVAAHCSLCACPIYYDGTEEQKMKYLVPLASGKKIGSFGLSEPNAGSDAGGTETMAVKEGNQWIINGQKRWITNGSYADVIVFTAQTNKELRHHGINSFIVEKGTPGFSPGNKEDKMGLRSSNTAELLFDDCRIPDENMLGKEGEGFKVFMRTLDDGRISIGVLGLGLGEGALEEGIKFAKENERGGKPLIKYQWVEKLFADTATELEAARHLIYHAAYLKDARVKLSRESAMAKLYASEAGTKACRKMMDLIGKDALNRLFPIQRLLRDAKLMEIGEGTSEVQRIVISRELVGR
ncbi:acyl-CoA dehydrogenase family protein [bacterium]|nr:acyl-CoA dehydrogenase family protein [bacterium]